jgi:hypothetical protein
MGDGQMQSARLGCKREEGKNISRSLGGRRKSKNFLRRESASVDEREGLGALVLVLALTVADETRTMMMM